MNASDISATRSWRSLRQKSCSGERADDVPPDVEETEAVCTRRP